MKSHTSLVAPQPRLSEWTELVRDCQNRPQGMNIDEWCQLEPKNRAQSLLESEIELYSLLKELRHTTFHMSHRICTKINRHIKHSTLHGTNKLALRILLQ